MEVKYHIYIKKSPVSHDADHFWIYPLEDTENWTGFGFRAKKDGILYLMHCPVCDMENYMSQSICYNCGFNPNESNLFYPLDKGVNTI